MWKGVRRNLCRPWLVGSLHIKLGMLVLAWLAMEACSARRTGELTSLIFGLVVAAVVPTLASPHWPRVRAKILVYRGFTAWTAFSLFTCASLLQLSLVEQDHWRRLWFDLSALNEPAIRLRAVDFAKSAAAGFIAGYMLRRHGGTIVAPADDLVRPTRSTGWFLWTLAFVLLFAPVDGTAGIDAALFPMMMGIGQLVHYALRTEDYQSAGRTRLSRLTSELSKLPTCRALGRSDRRALGRALSSLSDGRYKLAVRLLRHLDTPDNSLARVLLAVAERGRERCGEAVQILSEELRMPGRDPSYDPLLLCLKGRCELDRGNRRSAIESFEEARQSEQSCTVADVLEMVLKLEDLLWAGETPEPALLDQYRQRLDRAIERAHKPVACPSQHVVEHMYRMSIAFFKDALAYHRFAAGDVDGARRILLVALATDPHHTSTRLHYAEVLLALGRQHPDHRRAYSLRARTHIRIAQELERRHPHGQGYRRACKLLEQARSALVN